MFSVSVSIDKGQGAHASANVKNNETVGELNGLPHKRAISKPGHKCNVDVKVAQTERDRKRESARADVGIALLYK